MWALRLQGRDGTAAYTAASLAFALAFFVTRILCAWYCRSAACPVPWTLPTGTRALCVQSGAVGLEAPRRAVATRHLPPTRPRTADLPWVTVVVLFPLRDSVLAAVPAAGPVLLALLALNGWWWVRIVRMIARGGRRPERPQHSHGTADKLD